jgi:hypothetical protein
MADELEAAARVAEQAGQAWMRVRTHWRGIRTPSETGPPQALRREALDLVIRVGRLVLADPNWQPPPELPGHRLRGSSHRRVVLLLGPDHSRRRAFNSGLIFFGMTSSAWTKEEAAMSVILLSPREEGGRCPRWLLVRGARRRGRGLRLSPLPPVTHSEPLCWPGQPQREPVTAIQRPAELRAVRNRRCGHLEVGLSGRVRRDRRPWVGPAGGAAAPAGSGPGYSGPSRSPRERCGRRGRACRRRGRG